MIELTVTIAIEVDDAMDTAKMMGARVIRSQTLGDSIYFKGQWMLYYGCADSLVSVAMAPHLTGP